MLFISERIQLADADITWKFARSGGPGGQNVNKVASKAVLFWNMAASPSVPQEVKDRVRLRQPRFLTKDGVVVIASQKYRDQERNRQDCLDKLRAVLLQASARPKARKPTRPTGGSRRARLQAKKRRSAVKSARRRPAEES